MSKYEHLQKEYKALDAIEVQFVNYLILLIETPETQRILGDYSYYYKITQKKLKDIIKNLTEKGFLKSSGNYSYYLELDEEFKIRQFRRLVDDKENVKTLKAIETTYSQSRYFYRNRNDPAAFLRKYLMAVILNIGKVEEIIKSCDLFSIDLYSELTKIFAYPEYDDILRTMSIATRIDIAGKFLDNELWHLEPSRFDDRLLDELFTKEEATTSARFLFTIRQIQKGLIAESGILDSTPRNENQALYYAIGLLYFGKFTEAERIFTTALKALSKIPGNKDLLPAINFVFYYLLSILLAKPDNKSPLLTKWLKLYLNTPVTEGVPCAALIHYINLNLPQAKHLIKSANLNTQSGFTYFLYLTVDWLINGKLNEDKKRYAAILADRAITCGLYLVAYELYYLAGETNLPKQLQGFTFSPLLSRFEKTEEWSLALDSLLKLAGNTDKADKNQQSQRVVYQIDFKHHSVQPILQKLSAGGTWSKGRNIALKTMKESHIDGMTDQDKQVAKCIRINNSYYGTDYYFDPKVFATLAGHPYIYDASNPEIPLELIRTPLELTIEKTPKGYTLKMDISGDENGLIIRKETNTRYNLIEITEKHRLLAKTIHQSLQIVPTEGREMLQKTLAQISSLVTIHSDELGQASQLKTIEGDTRIRVQLLPMGDSLKAECFVKPFGTEPPYFKPGRGGKIVYGQVAGEKVSATRNLSAETSHQQQLFEALSGLSYLDFTEETMLFDDPLDCLELLEVVKAHPDICVAEWPEGQKMRITASAGLSQLNLRIKSRTNWFELEGEVAIDETLRLTLKELLALSRKSRSRFVELKNGEFLALSEAFRKRLNDLALVASAGPDGVRINQFAAQVIGNPGEGIGSFKVDKHWKALQERIVKGDFTETAVPHTLLAELRPYQEEGFRWLVRLAEWGAGACLADDMGLGKTIQTLALLLHRATTGPALVVCPASVMANWVAETARFAPTLNVLQLGLSNRNETLASLGANTLLVTTYGLIQSEEARLSAIGWATVVLDEAHAIKNQQSKTFKACMALKAEYRIALTGTPVQNRLSELWALFNFILPGLLGPWSHFNERFAQPIERDTALPEKQRLKKLIQPFILRRLKNEVLDELPDKTEITHQVQLSDAELAFYEALRHEAIANIESDAGSVGQRNLKALAEITRLRLACCNTALADPSIELPSAKSEAFFEIVEELLLNKHKALVFSQFIGQLARIRTQLDQRGIRYLYLDGSTPVADRQTLVNQFQAGGADIFLISLKAGGLGLNLTAADYVIHLDPWWNPAIEDQASDRAHRIGQQQPVTVYRLVAQNTIEEKILRLHHTKRGLADSLLEGSDKAASLSAKDILELLQEG